MDNYELPPPAYAAVAEAAGSVAESFQSRRSSRGSRKSRSDAMEASRLSQAASQALVAAQSILFSGGTPSTALSTAKAAAQSVLIPDVDEDGRHHSMNFLGRQKAKRQAEVIASMALTSASSAMLGDQASTSQAPRWDIPIMIQGSTIANTPRTTPRNFDAKTPSSTMALASPAPAKPTGQVPPRSVLPLSPRSRAANSRPPISGVKTSQTSMNSKGAPAVQVVTPAQHEPPMQDATDGTLSVKAKAPHLRRARTMGDYFRRKGLNPEAEEKGTPIPEANQLSPRSHKSDKNLAAPLAQEDPIYDTADSGINGSFNSNRIYSDSTEDSSQLTDDFMTAGSVGSSALDHGRFRRREEPYSPLPFLTSLTKIFECGPKGKFTFENTGADNLCSKIQLENDDAHDDATTACKSKPAEYISPRMASTLEWQEMPPPPQAQAGPEERDDDTGPQLNRDDSDFRKMNKKELTSMSSAESTAVIKQLNTKSDERNDMESRPLKLSTKESRESIVLRALSATPPAARSRSSFTESDRISSSRVEKGDALLSGLQPNPGRMSSAPVVRHLSNLTQQVSSAEYSVNSPDRDDRRSQRFRTWYKLRRTQTSQDSATVNSAVPKE